MKVIISQNYDKMSEEASRIIVEHMKRMPHITLGLATGSTPEGVYKNLIKAYQDKQVSFEHVYSFNLDEYIGINQNHPQSYYQYMMQHLFNDVNMQNSHIFLPKNDIEDLLQHVKDYNISLKKHPIDLQLLGIGQNGHIGFNEPGTSFDQETFIVTLDQNTRMANLKYFDSIEEVPTKAITMGIKNIMQSKEIILLASGENKAKAVKDMIEGPVSTSCPASVLQLHPHVTVIIDKKASYLLSKK